MSNTQFRASQRARKTLSGTIISAIVIALMALGILGAASVASAHDTLLSTNPTDGAKVETLPGKLVLEFSANILDTGIAVEVDGPDGARWSDGDPTVKGAKVTAPLLPDAPAGDYAVTWRVVSSDGHPISGTFGFTATEGAAATEGSTTDPAADANTSLDHAEPHAQTSPESDNGERTTADAPHSQAPTTDQPATSPAGQETTTSAPATNDGNSPNWGRTALFGLLGAVVGAGLYAFGSARRRRNKDATVGGGESK